MIRMIASSFVVAAALLWSPPLMACETCGCGESVGEKQAQAEADTVIVLVGHGAPAKDFPKDKLGRFFQLGSSQHSHSHGDGQARGHDDEVEEYRQLEQEVRDWPRTPENDPYKCGVEAIAKSLSEKTGLPVIVGFNEFCAPSTGAAIDQAIAGGAKRVLVTTVMMTPGGGHSERDIARSVESAGASNPDVSITYAWPINTDLIASLLAEHLGGFEADAHGHTHGEHDVAADHHATNVIAGSHSH